MADQTKAQIGSGVELAYWSGTAWTTLGNIRSINGIGVARTEVDSTTLEDAAVNRIPGIRDGKQVTITFTTGAPNGTITLVSGWVDTSTDIDYRLTLPAPASEVRYFTLVPMDYTFSAIDANKLIEMSFVGRITGPVTSVATH
jgi:hypothetical protein